jgi:hypothetical protein
MQKFNWHVFNVELSFASKTFTFPLHSPLTMPLPSPLSTCFRHCPTPRPNANAHPTRRPPLCHMPPTSSMSSPTHPPSEEGCIRYVIPALYILDAHANTNAHAHVHAHAHTRRPRACRCSMVSSLTTLTPSSTRRRLVHRFPQDTTLSSHMPVEGSLCYCPLDPGTSPPRSTETLAARIAPWSWMSPRER